MHRLDVVSLNGDHNSQKSRLRMWGKGSRNHCSSKMASLVAGAQVKQFTHCNPEKPMHFYFEKSKVKGLLRRKLIIRNNW